VPPRGGVWRVGRAQEPIRFPDPLTGKDLEDPHAGSRFDSPTEAFRTCYFTTDPRASFGEKLANFRPNPELVEAADEAGFMGVGQVPADWRHQRVLVRVDFEPTESRPSLHFLDVEARSTRGHLEKELARILASYDLTELDVPTVRGGDRRITRWIAKWAFDQRDEDDRGAYAGIRYLSRLDTNWECWAVFDDVGIGEIKREPITHQNPDLLSIARSFDLTVH
jgi:hypothetical protein